MRRNLCALVSGSVALRDESGFSFSFISCLALSRAYNYCSVANRMCGNYRVVRIQYNLWNSSNEVVIMLAFSSVYLGQNLEFHLPCFVSAYSSSFFYFQS